MRTVTYSNKRNLKNSLLRTRATRSTVPTQINNTMRKERIVVPQRIINGGFDFKFETDPYDINLFRWMSPEEYTDAITRINDSLRPSRSTKLDSALFYSGPLMVPLAVWGVRHSRQVKKRKKLFRSAMDEFNTNYPALYMRWNKRQGGSILTIEKRDEQNHGPAPINYNNVTGNDNETALVIHPESSNQLRPDYLL